MSYAAVKTALEMRGSDYTDLPVIFEEGRHRKSAGEVFLLILFQPGAVTHPLVGGGEPAEYRGQFDILIYETSHMAAVIRSDTIRALFSPSVVLKQDEVNVYLEGCRLIREKSDINHSRLRLRVMWRSYF